MKPAPVLFTFHKIREQSEQGNAPAWRALLEFYGSMLIRLLEVHAAISLREAFPVAQKTMAALAADNFARLRATPRESEREFLGALRGLLFETALESGVSRESATPGALQPETITKLLDDLPLLHKEMLFFKFSGYTDNTIERIMRLSPRVADKAFERLTGEYEPARQLHQDRSPWPASWLAFLKQARALKTENSGRT